MTNTHDPIYLLILYFAGSSKEVFIFLMKSKYKNYLKCLTFAYKLKKRKTKLKIARYYM